MKPKITEDQLLNAIESLTSRFGVAPTLRELSRHFGFRSISSVQARVNRLLVEGRLTFEPHKARTLRVLKPPRTPDSNQALLNLIGRAERALSTLGESSEVEELRDALEGIKATVFSEAGSNGTQTTTIRN